MSSLISCPHCSHQIHDTAPTCPQCGAARAIVAKPVDTYTTYEQVPWFRRRWFAFVSIILFMPLFLIIAFTGNVYFTKNGELQTIPPRSKFIVLGIFVVLFLIRLQN